MLKYAIQNAFRKRGITILAIIGIMFGVGLMVTLNAFSEGLHLKISDEAQNSIGLVEIREVNASQFYLNSLRPDLAVQIEENSPDHNKIISSSKGYYFPYSTLNQSGNGYTSAGTSRKIRLAGYDLDVVETLSPAVDSLIEGRWGNSDNKECVVPDILIKEVPNKFDIGQSIDYIVNNTHKFKLDIVGIYKSNVDEHSINMIAMFDIFVDLELSEDLWAVITEGENNAFHYLSENAKVDSFSIYQIKYNSATLNETENIIANLKIFLESKHPDMQYQIYPKGKYISTFEGIKVQVEMFLSIVTIVTLIAGSMSIIISQLIGAEQRKNEFAILKATGWKNSHILREVLYESIMISIIGGILGLGLGILGNIGFSSVNSLADGIITFKTIILSFIITLSLGIIGGMSPAIKASKIQPIELLRST